MTLDDHYWRSQLQDDEHNRAIVMRRVRRCREKLSGAPRRPDKKAVPRPLDEATDAPVQAPQHGRRAAQRQCAAAGGSGDEG